mgnify:CR=1 FL=1
METQIRDIIAHGTKITGKITGHEPLLIEGQIEGSIALDNLLVIGKNAVVKADIAAKAVTVDGIVEGKIEATDLIAVRSGARVSGEVVTPRLIVEDEAIFDGNISMNNISA